MSDLVVGSRGSQLALHQARYVVDELARLNPGLTCRIEIIKTTGDRVTDVPLSQIGDRGLFVKEIELALMEGRIDFAVHSAKDLPSEMSAGLCIAAYSEREDPSDALVSKAGRLSEMPEGARVGTSSVRRQAQLLAARPDLRMVDLRGNLDTRLRKAESPYYDAVVLARAGLRRLGLESRVTELLPFDVCLPAAGQGALAVQCREGDPVAETLASFDHPSTRACVEAERAFLARLGAGCQTPVAALAEPDRMGIRLRVAVASLDGSNILRGGMTGDGAAAKEIGARLAEDMLAAGALDLLEEVRMAAGPKATGAA